MRWDEIFFLLLLRERERRRWREGWGLAFFRARASRLLSSLVMASSESLAQLKARLWSAWGMSEARTRTLSRCSCSSCSHAFFFCISPLRNLLLLSNSSSAPSISFSLLYSTLYLLKPHFLLFYLLLLSVCLHFISDKKKERKDDEDEDENQRERGRQSSNKTLECPSKNSFFWATGRRQVIEKLRSYPFLL